MEICQGANRTSSQNRGLISSERVEWIFQAQNVPHYCRRQATRWQYYIFWACTRKLSAIASGATPIGSAGRAPDKKKSTKGRRRDWSLWSATSTCPWPQGLLTSGALVVHPMIENQMVDKWYRRNRLPLVDNKLWLHCRQNKDRLLPSGVIYENLKNSKLK
jgi:hypothetical protein